MFHSLFSSALSTEAGNCIHGDIRLTGGANVTLGRVEICLYNAWGTVCNTQFGQTDAEVICKQLGYRPNGTNHLLSLQLPPYILYCIEAVVYTTSSMFGEEAGGPIFLSDLSCSSEETTLLECLHSTVHQCDHTQDVGVQCFGKN